MHLEFMMIGKMNQNMIHLKSKIEIYQNHLYVNELHVMNVVIHWQIVQQQQEQFLYMLLQQDIWFK